MALLAASDEPVDFNTALSELGLTRGNLSTHIVKLEEAKFVKVHKEFVGKKPRTTYECTAAGRKEIKTYLAQIKSLLQVKSGRAS